MSDVVYKQYISTSYFPKYVSENFIGKIYPVPSETGIVFFQKSVKDWTVVIILLEVNC